MDTNRNSASSTTAMQKFERVALVLLNAFLGLTAVAGGLSLVFGWNSPPVEDLGGSPFGSYVVPGLALVVLVGGSALLATLALVRRQPLSAALAVLAGAMILCFEAVEVLVIGSPAGVARTLQLFYVALGLAVVALAGHVWVQERVKSVPRAESDGNRRQHAA